MRRRAGPGPGARRAARSGRGAGRLRGGIRRRERVPQPGTGGTVTLWANGRLIGEGKMPHTVPVGFSTYAGMDIGRDNGLVVDRAYEDRAPYAFTGNVKKVVFDLKPAAHEDEKALHEHAQIQGIGQGAAG